MQPRNAVRLLIVLVDSLLLMYNKKKSFIFLPFGSSTLSFATHNSQLKYYSQLTIYGSQPTAHQQNLSTSPSYNTLFDSFPTSSIIKMTGTKGKKGTTKHHFPRRSEDNCRKAHNDVYCCVHQAKCWKHNESHMNEKPCPKCKADQDVSHPSKHIRGTLLIDIPSG